jgi:spore photoproduct lyase
MIEMPAQTVYVDPRVYELVNCRQRLERMLPLIRCDDVRDLDAAARADVAAIGQRRHGKDAFGDNAVFVFTAWEDDREDRYFHLRPGRAKLEREGIVCQDALELNPIFGCPFRCAYCGFGRVVRIMLDVEEFMGRLPGIFAQYPGQRLYKFSNMTDLPPFEPEYDAVLPMVRLFAREKTRYLMLFTKSRDIDFLIGAEHAGHTIISWSLSGPTVSRDVDRGTATMEERIDAMRRCQEDGYIVRARISPIVPVHGWREDYRQMFEALFAAARPDIVTLEMLGWFDFEDLSLILSPDMLDGAAYRAAEAAAEGMRGRRKSPFPFDVRREVYEFCISEVRRLSPGTCASVCHGTPRMWKELGPRMGMSPEDFVCNCGPLSTPGHPLLRARS